MKLEIEGLDKRLSVGFLTWLLSAIICSCSPHAGSTEGQSKKALRASSGSPRATVLLARAADDAAAAPAGALDFTLINYTGLSLHRIYVSPHDSAGWEENLLGGNELSDGEIVEIRFAPEEQAVMWDLRVEDEYGNNAEWKNLNLRQISKITLRRGDNVAIAEAE